MKSTVTLARNIRQTNVGDRINAQDQTGLIAEVRPFFRIVIVTLDNGADLILDKTESVVLTTPDYFAHRNNVHVTSILAGKQPAACIDDWRDNNGGDAA